MRFRKLCFGQIGSSETINYVVDELKRYVKAIDREVMVEVVMADKPISAAYNVIWVGIHEDLHAAIPAVADPAQDDAIAISVENGKGYISGTNERSVLIAAYRFLKELGCDWVRPGDDGFRVAKQPLENICVSCFEAASSRYRGICMEGAIAYQHVMDLIEYMPKIGMNEYFVQFFLPATFFENWSTHSRNRYIEEETKFTEELMGALVLKIEQELAKRKIRYHKVGHGWTAKPFGMNTSGWYREKVHVVPEEAKPYLALIDGVRGLKNNSPMDTQLCYSNPIARTKIVDCVVAYAKENPHIDFLHVWDGDNLHNHCECEECVKKHPSDWILMIMNELDEKLSAAGLDTKIAFVVSRDKLWAPLTEKLNNPDRFAVMYAPITRTFGNYYGECLDDPGEMTEFKRNRNTFPSKLADNVAYLRQWQKIYSGDIFVYDYHLIFGYVNDPGFERIAKLTYNDMRTMHLVGINGLISCQVQRVAFPTNLPQHVMAATLWNRDCDYDAVADEYYLKAFGPDGLKLRKYLSVVSDNALMSTRGNFGSLAYANGPFFTNYEEVYKALEDILPTIQENVAKDNVYTQEWKYIEHHHAYTKLYVRMYELWEQHKKEECLETAEQMFDLIAKNEEWTHPVFDVNFTDYFIRRRLELTKRIPEKMNDTTGM